MWNKSSVRWIYFLLLLFYVAIYATWHIIDTLPPNPEPVIFMGGIINLKTAILMDFNLLYSLTPQDYINQPVIFYVGFPFSLIAEDDWHVLTAVNLVFIAILLGAMYYLGILIENQQVPLIAAAFTLFSPLTAGLTRHLYPDVAQTAMVALAVTMVFTTRGFKDKRRSALAGAAFGVGMLTKISLFSFLLGPILATAFLTPGANRRTESMNDKDSLTYKWSKFSRQHLLSLLAGLAGSIMLRLMLPRAFILQQSGISTAVALIRHILVFGAIYLFARWIKGRRMRPHTWGTIDYLVMACFISAAIFFRNEETISSLLPLWSHNQAALGLYYCLLTSVIFAPFIIWQSKTTRLNNLLLYGLVALAFCFHWYFLNIPTFVYFMEATFHSGEALLHGPNEVLSLESLLFYPIKFVKHQGFILSILLVLCLAAIILQRLCKFNMLTPAKVSRDREFIILVLSWIVFSMLIYLSMINKDYRYTLPLLPAIGLFIGYTIDRLRFIWLQKAAIAFLFVAGTIQVILTSFVRMVPPQEFYWYIDIPRTEDWKFEEIIKTIETSREPEKEIHVGVFTNMCPFHPESFQAVIRKMRLERLFVIDFFNPKAGSPQDRILGCDYLVLKDKKHGITSEINGVFYDMLEDMLKGESLLLEQNFKLIETFSLHDGTKALLYAKL